MRAITSMVPFPQNVLPQCTLEKILDKLKIGNTAKINWPLLFEVLKYMKRPANFHR